jgi:hypothetical protein
MKRWPLWVCLLPLAATAMRDPLEPPGAARAATAPIAAEGQSRDPVIRHLVTVDGTRWLLDGARRFGVGDRLGGLRIECIHDDGVTVRDEAGLRRRLPLFGAVDIRATGSAPVRKPDCPAPKTSTRSMR